MDGCCDALAGDVIVGSQAGGGWGGVARHERIAAPAAYRIFCSLVGLGPGLGLGPGGLPTAGGRPPPPAPAAAPASAPAKSSFRTGAPWESGSARLDL